MTICTDAFEKMAELERRVLGKPELAVAIIEHPLVYRNTEEIEQLADSIMPMLDDLFATALQ